MGFGLLTGAFAAVVIWALTDDPPSQRTRAACDRAVADLLSTNDLVTLERSKFLIERLHCVVEKRLP
jgi:hypothetical protein